MNRKKAYKNRAELKTKMAELIASGATIDQACKDINIAKSTYYKWAKMADEPKVTVHEPQVKEKRTYNTRPKQNKTSCAVFMGDMESCAEFYRQFKQ